MILSTCMQTKFSYNKYLKILITTKMHNIFSYNEDIVTEYNSKYINLERDHLQ